MVLGLNSIRKNTSNLTDRASEYIDVAFQPYYPPTTQLQIVFIDEAF